MVNSSAPVTGNSGKTQQNRQIFTFFVEDMMFGIDVEHVLMLDQNTDEIQRLPLEERGFCGITKFQGTAVPVLDFAHRLGVSSGIEQKSALLATLTQSEQDHIEWLNALENTIRTGVAFTKATNPKECAFGKWHSQFSTRDQTLQELLEAFTEPHQAIHAMAEKLLALRDNGKESEAIQELNHVRATVLRRLRTLFSRIKEHISSSMRQVLLFVTTDRKNPRYALLIDEINDVVNYTSADYQASNQGALKEIRKIAHVIDGIFTRAGQEDCLYFNLDKLTDIDELMKKVS